MKLIDPKLGLLVGDIKQIRAELQTVPLAQPDHVFGMNVAFAQG